MTELEKIEIAELVAELISKHGSCPAGVSPETARELISFAQTWKTCRKAMITGIVTTVIGGLLIGLWTGIKSILGR